jgi:quercetin dioxygenase-like cupin family protein
LTDDSAPPFPYVRQVDFAALAAAGPEVRYVQKLLDRADGADAVGVGYIRTPPGGGSPEGLHTHVVEQVFYVLSGTMTVEVDGHRSEVGPGGLVHFPQGVPHRNWNAGATETVHLSITGPAPDPGVPFSLPAGGEDPACA